MSDIAIKARITGRVQRVAFRAWTQSEAKQRGLSGWVRNEPDGAVLALFMGQATEVAAMMRVLNQGAPAARVTHVFTEEVVSTFELTGFQITR